MNTILPQVITWHTAYIVALWFIAGVALSWGRGLWPSMVVPALVVGAPALAAPGSGPGGVALQTLPMGTGAGVYIASAILPFLASMIGGHVAMAVNPEKRDRRRSRTTLRQTTSELHRLTDEIDGLHTAIRSQREPAARITTAAPSVSPAPAERSGSAAFEAELAVMRAQLASRHEALERARRRLSA